MTSIIYLVDGDWYDYEDRGHWTVAAFSTLKDAEQFRKRCQDWIDQYCDDFWAEYIRRFGEPRDRCWTCAHGTCTDNSEACSELAEAWFEPQYNFSSDGPDAVRTLNTTVGRFKMQQLSPDPFVEVQAGEPCTYSIVEVTLDTDDRPATRQLGPRHHRLAFEKWYCAKSELTIEQYSKKLITLRCLCGDDNCPGWAAVLNTPESIARHNDLYGVKE